MSLAVLIACGSPPRAVSEPAPQQLPPSPVTVTEKSPDRAEVIAFCEKYRRAMEARDVSALMALVSPRYADDEGVTYATAERTLKKLFSEANQIRYDIRYGDVTRRSDGAIEVDYHYTASYLTASGWQHKTSDSKLVLERRDGSFAIVSGM